MTSVKLFFYNFWTLYHILNYILGLLCNIILYRQISQINFSIGLAKFVNSVTIRTETVLFKKLKVLVHNVNQKL